MILLKQSWLPWVILAIIVVAAVTVWAIYRRRGAMKYLQGLKTSASPFRRKLASIALVVALVLSLLTLLRPSGGNTVSENRLPAKNVIILFDVSMSMAAADAGELTRIEAAKIFANEFVSRRTLDRVGLISFAGAAFPEVPVTLDRTVLQERINVQKPGGLPAGGTDLENALEEAAALLTEDPPPGSAIVLISDGDNIRGEPMKTVEKFADRNIPIFVLALGESGVPFEIPYKQVTTTADHKILSEIVHQTRGQMFLAVPERMDSILSDLDQRLDSIEFNGEDVASQIYQRPLELYAYPLAVALCCLFIYFAIPVRTKRWHPLKTIVLLGVLTGSSVQAVDYEGALKQARSEKLPLLLLFTGSDWSKTSIAFKREVLDQPIYQEWAETNVISLLIDLPHEGIEREERSKRRELASRFSVASYPVAIFLDRNGDEMGRLNYGGSGPRFWIDRAKFILSGKKSASDLPNSIKYLPDNILKKLEDQSIDDEQRALRHYNQGVEFEIKEPDLAIESEDRRDLLTALYSSASRFAPKDRPEIIAAAQQKLGLLHHRLARKALPVKDDTLQTIAARTLERPSRDPAKPFTDAIKECQKAMRYYANAASLSPGNEELTNNLSLVYHDMKRLKDLAEYVKARKTAIETVYKSWQQEARFLQALELGVTTSAPINKEDIDRGVAAINDLIAKAELVKKQPTIVTEEEIADFGLAKEDMDFAPPVHKFRKLGEAEMHIKNALDHLVDLNNQPQQGQEQDGEREPQRGDRQGDRPEPGAGEDEEQGPRGNSDQDLRRARKNLGSLRNRLMDRMRRDAEPVSPSEDH